MHQHPFTELPPDLWRNDESLRRAGELLDRLGGNLRAVTFDFFDTLVWRLTAQPTGVFSEVARRLRQEGHLPEHISDQAYEVLRRHAEAKAREQQTLANQTREDCALTEIVAELKAVVPQPEVAAKTELGAEGDFCFLNPVLFQFAAHARQRGLKLFIVSDIYLSADHLRGILRANHLDPKFFDGIFTSSDAGVCKWSGKLFAHVLKELKCQPREILHLGDNLHSDVIGARKAGVRGCHYVQSAFETNAVLEREKFLLGSQSPVASVNSLRLLAARNFPGDGDEAFFGRAGALLAGPLLARYASWACEQFVAAGIRKVGAFMREGELLGQMLQQEAATEGHALDIAPLYVNRKSTELAAIGDLTATGLIDWVGRRQTLKLKTVLQHFGLQAAELRNLPFPADEKINSRERLLQVGKFLFAPEITERIQKRSAAQRRKIMDYLRPWLEAGGTFGVCDIGYNATAQTQLKRIFEMEKCGAKMIGCYLVTCEMAARRMLDGLDVRHFLGAFGYPAFNHFAFLRSPAFIEQSLVAGCGTTLGYERMADGGVKPVLDEMRFPPELLRRQKAFKTGILHYQNLWLHFRAQKPDLLGGKTPSSRRWLQEIDLGCAPILARAAAFPTQSEVANFGSLPLDDYYFAEGFKTICGEKDREFLRSKGYGAALPDQGVLWPQAANLQLNPRAAGEFFSFAKGMLQCQSGSDPDGLQAGLTVIIASQNPGQLRRLLSQIGQKARAEFAREIILLLDEGDKKCAAVVEELAGTFRRLQVFNRPPTQSVAQQFNQAVDHARAPLLLFLNDSAELADGWDQAVTAAFTAETGAVLATSDASCVAFRRLAVMEVLSFAEKISAVAAHWKMLLDMRELGWQIKPGLNLVTCAIPQKISAPDRSALSQWFPEFEKLTAEMLAQNRAHVPAVAPPTRLVSIIILVLNQLEHTRACLESIAAHTSLPHEIIVVDNGSTDDTPEFLKAWSAAHRNCTVIRNESNRGFAGGNNQGLAVARGEHVLLLNNDTVVTAGWLEAMLAVFGQHPETGLVGPMSNRVSGPQLLREAVYQTPAEMHAFAQRYVLAHAGESFEIVRAVGFCLLAKRAIIAKLGGLDEKFGSGNFEDDDFCLRAQMAGFRIRIARDAFVHHAGSQTFAGQKINYAASLRRNWEIFRTKWELPAEASLERGYPIPKQLPKNLSVHVPLPVLTNTHVLDGARWTEKKKTAPMPKLIQPAPVAKIGRLDEARELFAAKNLAAAWKETRAAITRRPFHPEAHLLLAQIALAAGGGTTAKLCAQRARELAPGWEPVKNFLQQPLKGEAKLDWLDTSRPVPQAPRLSVCLIVKNEEKFLAQCLKSVRGFANQIIVVDTGSTDRTVEIAKEFGAEIYSFAWCDDFAAARNAALKHANGDWILMLDADEELSAAQHAKLRADMKDAANIAIRLPLVNAGQENEGRSFVPRLFRNAPGAFFTGRIHEQIFSSLLDLAKNWGLKTALGTAELLHHGYAKELIRDRNKIERNLKLLRAATAEDPNDPNLLMNLGLELVRSEQLAEGVEKYREAFDLMSVQPATAVTPELREVLLTQFTSQLYKLNAHEEVVQVLHSPLAEQTALTASLHFALGLAHFELRQFREAADQMRQCLTKRKQPGLTPINTDINTAAPQHCLALCLIKLSELPAAEKAFLAALGETGNVEAAKLDYAKFLRNENRPVEALHKLHEIVAANTRDLAAWRLGGEIALSKPEFLEFARDWTGEAMQAQPDNPVIAAQRAEALMLTDDSASAHGLWEKIWRSEPDPRTLAALILCELASGEIKHAPNAEDEQAASLAFVQWYQKLIAANARGCMGKINERLAQMAPALPSAAQMLEAALSEADVAAAV